MNKLFFFGIASAILLFSIIVINISPMLHGIYQIRLDYNRYSSCKYLSDIYDKHKDDGVNEETLDDDKRELNRCNRQQAMEGLEYSSLNVNIVIGFICALLGLLNYLNLGNVGKITGLIGLGGGVVGFVLSFVYVIESGLVFDDNDGSRKFKIDSDGAFLEWDQSRGSYTCIFYDKDNKYSIYLKYANYGNKYLSYNKDSYSNFIKDDKYKYADDATATTTSGFCNYYSSTNFINWEYCKKIDEKETGVSIPKERDCNKLLYIDQTIDSNEYKILFDKWLTSIILSCIIFLLDIGLALFGFLLFRESNGSSGAVSIK